MLVGEKEVLLSTLVESGSGFCDHVLVGQADPIHLFNNENT